MKVLVAFEQSGEVRRAFRAVGAEAYSLDILPSEDNSPYHIVADAYLYLRERIHEYDLVIAHPPCTYLCSSGLHWNKRVAGRQALTDQSIAEVKGLYQLALETNVMLAIENPIGCLSTHLRKPDQIIQPYQYGHDASKSTCLWLLGLPKLTPTLYVEPRIVNGKKRWANQTDSGQNKLGPSPDRWKERSKTYTGIAQAMASQWLSYFTQTQL